MGTDSSDSGRTESEQSFSRFGIGLRGQGGQPSPEAFQKLLNDAEAACTRYEERIDNQKMLIDRQKNKILECQGILVQQDRFLRDLRAHVVSGQTVLDSDLSQRLERMLDSGEGS